jgi:hypothetical protein
LETIGLRSGTRTDRAVTDRKVSFSKFIESSHEQHGVALAISPLGIGYQATVTFETGWLLL